jgi:signal recognition particle subunit SRP54
MAGKLTSGEGFTREDFVEQLAMVRKLGPIGNLLGMLPGAAQNRELLSQVSDKDLDRAAAIVNSMTKEERQNPKIINGSRRARIAGGSGVTVGEVSQLIVRFLEGQKMMRQMMGSMPGMGGMRRTSKSRGKAKKKGRGGGRPVGVSRGTGAGDGAGAGRPAAAGPNGGPGGPGAGALGAGGAGMANPAALPGFGSLPGLGNTGNSGFRLPAPPGGSGQGGGGQSGLPPAFRGRQGKKGR